MIPLKSEKRKIEPIVFVEKVLFEKMYEKLQGGYGAATHACLLKYFPKCYRKLYLEREKLTRPVESKVKQLKIVRSCNDYVFPKDDEKVFKRLFRTNRKTLKNVPKSGDYHTFQDLSLCAYFPGVKTLDLEYSNIKLRDELPLKKVYGLFGYFWSGSRYVEKLKVVPYHDFELAILKKIDGSKRFLSFLKKVELEIHATHNHIETSRKVLIELIGNKNFLGHVTHLEVGSFEENRLDWELVQSLINSCPQLYFLSVPIGDRDRRSGSGQGFIKKDFYLNLRCVHNLQVLCLNVEHFKSFINGIQFPSFLREMRLSIVDHEESDSLKEFFDCPENHDDMDMLLQEDQDVKDWESFEKSKKLIEFFGKWRKLESLKVFSLYLRVLSEMDTVERNFVLPLLRAIPCLETFNYRFDYKQYQIPQGYSRSFNLEAFLSEIGPLRSLRHLEISTDVRHNCIFPGLYHPEKLSSLSTLSSIRVEAKINSCFDLKKFLNVFLCKDTLRLNNSIVKKSLQFPRFYLFCVQDFIRLLNLIHSVSDLENFKAHLEIALVVENIDDIYSNFKYPVYVAKNILLSVGIFLKNFEFTTLTREQVEYLQMVFGQFQFTVKKSNPRNCERNSFSHYCTSHGRPLKSKDDY